MAEKKTTPTKKASTKKTPAKKATTKKPTTAPHKKSAASQTDIQSMKVCKESEPFMTTRVTQQTVYWLIIGLAVMLLGLWILKVQNEVQAIYDQIEMNNIILDADFPESTSNTSEQTEATSTDGDLVDNE